MFLRFGLTTPTISGMASREQLNRVRDAIEDGHELSLLADELGMDASEVDTAARQIFERIVTRLQGTPRELMFAEFLLAAYGHMRQLHKIAGGEKTRAGDAVSAIKTSFAIRTKVMDEARSFGVISREPDKVVGIDISYIRDMSNDEIRHALANIPKMVERFDREYTSVGLMDVDAGPMFGSPEPN